MTLSPHDLADLHRLAHGMAPHGKRPAIRAYHAHAAASGWHGSPAWIEGREAFMKAWREVRR